MTTSTPFEQGPYLSAALLCEKVLIEQDGVKSAIRIIDRVTRTAVGPSPPEEMAPFEHEIALFVRLKSGWARGSYPLRIRFVKPDSESLLPPFQSTIPLEGEEDRGADVVVNMKLRLDMPGIYWFHVELGDIRLTQVPLRVIYIRQVTQTHGGGGGSPPALEPPTGP